MLFAIGAALLFAPVEIVPAAPLIAQLLASALLGFAAADWTGRVVRGRRGIYNGRLVSSETSPPSRSGGLVAFAGLSEQSKREPFGPLPLLRSLSL